MNHAFLVFLLVPLFVLIFGSCWYFIPLLLSKVGGWGRLAERFPGAPEPAGQRFNSQSARVGCVSYNNCLTICLSREGLYLRANPLFRAGHPPLLIPWGEIHDVKAERILWAEYAAFQVGSPTVTTLRLSKKIFDQASALLTNPAA